MFPSILLKASTFSPFSVPLVFSESLDPDPLFSSFPDPSVSFV